MGCSPSSFGVCSVFGFPGGAPATASNAAATRGAAAFDTASAAAAKTWVEPGANRSSSSSTSPAQEHHASADKLAATLEQPAQGTTAPARRSVTSTLEAVDHDPTLWHGREAAAGLVRQWTEKTTQGASTKGASGQGILLGVIFPCMANILGVLLFLRLPWIVGKAGILHGFSLVFICCCCTFITTLSLSAIATNGKIKGGGAYYLISRSLGPALGAGVGLCFYMANSIGAAMYFMGTVEAWEIAAPNSQLLTVGDLNNIRVTAFCILAVALLLVGLGIKYVARLGTFFLFIVLGVIVCMYCGCLIGPGSTGSPYEIVATDADGNAQTLKLEWGGTHFSENFLPGYSEEQKAFPLDRHEYSFIDLMALWFPAVTGIMAGSNRSADLADPQKTIPKGTLFAQSVTSCIYLSFVCVYGSVAPRTTLLDDKFFASSSAWPLKEIVLYGVMASTIGAGLTSLVSGTRLLSAIAVDRTLPILSVFAVSSGSEPHLALVASGALCACAIAIGELNAVAPVLTMFFLMCYTCVNLSCTILPLVADPNWRPSFRFYHWSVSLAGAILCLWMMFAISAVIAMLAMLFALSVFAYAAYNSHEVKWGDGFQGMKFQLARNILTHMDFQAHTKNWRPQLLVVAEACVEDQGVLNVRDKELLKVCSQLKGGRGFVIVGGICSCGVDIFGTGGVFASSEGNQSQKVLDGQEYMQRLLQKYDIQGFGRLVYAQDFLDGLMSLVQISGLGAFQPNCVLAAWPKDWRDSQEARAHFVRMVQVAVVFQKVMLVSKGFSWPSQIDKMTGHIDVWWIVGDGGILLLLPFLLSKHPVWQRAKTRLFLFTQNEDDEMKVKKDVETYVADFRLSIEVHVKIDKMVDTSGLASDDADGELKRQFSANSISKSISKLRRPMSPDIFPLTPARAKGGQGLTAVTSDSSLRDKRGGVPPKSSSSSRSTPPNDSAAQFLQNTELLTSAQPCSEEALSLARRLNQHIANESCDANLVVTNLIDMIPNESTFGYFQFIDKMTKDLARILLVRGTDTEVITAFT